MEWILQVADDIDDAIGALRLCSLGLAAEIGLLAAGGLRLAGKRPARRSTVRKIAANPAL